jgi:hypothetical protein
MNVQLDRMVQAIVNQKQADFVGVLSTGERCFVALASNRYDLLPASYADPIEAWNRLEPDLRRQVCEWRGWPNRYAQVGA